MITKFIVVLSAIAVVKTLPVIYDNGLPAVVWNVGREPSVSYSYGSGFSSDIGGVKQSSGVGASFQSGEGSAYGAGIGSTGGNTFASGVGYAQAVPTRPLSTGFQQATGVALTDNVKKINSAVSSAQNFGNFGSAVSATQAQNAFGSAVSATQGNGLSLSQSVVSSAQNKQGLGYESAASSASSNGFGYGSAISAAQNVGRFGNNYGSSVAASQNYPGYSASVANSVQQQKGSYQQSGASSVNAHGVQTAQSHAVNVGY